VDGDGLPVRLGLTGGQAAEVPGAEMGNPKPADAKAKAGMSAKTTRWAERRVP